MPPTDLSRLLSWECDFAWGISAAEYERHPEGDLLAIPMIETAEGLKNVDEIAAARCRCVFIGAGAD